MLELCKIPGCLVRIEESGHTAQAFVPYPLPPSIEVGWDLVNILSEADRRLAELAGLGRTMTNPQLLVQPLIKKEAVLSSKIEGTRTELDDLYAFELGIQATLLRKNLDQEDALEVANYVKAMEVGLNRLKELPMSLRLIREIHAQLLHDVRGEDTSPGEFRRIQNWIGSPDSTIDQATFVPPPVSELDQCLKDFENYLHLGNNHPLLIRLAFINYQYETNHPIRDGNGRIGCLLIPLLMVAWNMLPSPLLYLSEYFEKNREQYNILLRNVSHQGHWQAWVRFFLQGVAQQSLAAMEKIKKLQDLQADWHKRLLHPRASASQVKLADALFESPYIWPDRARRILGVTHQGAMNIIRKLVDNKVLTAISVGRSKIYIASELLEVLR